MNGDSGSEESAIEACVESILGLLRQGKQSDRHDKFKSKIRYQLECLTENVQWLHELNFVEKTWDQTLIDRIKLVPNDRETLFRIAGRIQEYKQRLKELKKYQ